MNVLRYFVVKKAKNYADLTEEESTIVQRIIVLCVAKLHSFLMTHKDPKKSANHLLKSSHSRKEHFLVDSVFRALGMSAEDLLFPQELNKKATERIRRVILDLEIGSSNYFKSWEVTEALQELQTYHVFGNIRGKEKYKEAAPKAHRLKKGAGYNSKEGLYSFYKITENLSTLNKIVANPKALEIIHKGLLEYGVLEKFYLFWGKAVLHAMKHATKVGDESMFRFAVLGTQGILEGSPEIQAQVGAKGLDPKRIEYPYDLATIDFS